MKRQNTPAAEEPAKKKRRRRATDPKTGLTVFEPNTVYFNDYLETYIGAKWQAIKKQPLRRRLSGLRSKPVP